MRRHPWLMVLMLGVLAGCAHGAKSSRPVPALAAPGTPQITRLIVDYTAAAAKQTSDDDRFHGEALNKALERGLTAAALADLSNTAVVRVAVIEVDEFDVRATGNVVLMGRVASAAVLGATVRIRDGSGAELRRFPVRTEMRLNLARDGSDRDTLARLYQGFTMLVVDELTGTPRRPAQGR